MYNVTEKFLKKVVFCFFSVMILFLCIISVYGSCYVNNDEYTYFLSDHAFVNIVATLVVILLVTFIRKKIDFEKYKKIFQIVWIVLLVICFFSLLGISLYISMEPRADQKFVLETALSMINGDYSAFDKGGYMDVYPNQVGIVYFFYWMLRVFPFGYKTICVLNALSVIFIVCGMKKIQNVLFESVTVNVGGIATMLFLPLAFYVTFIYGNLIGMALSTWGIYFTIQFWKQHSVKTGFVAAFLSVLAVVIKENFLIAFIGIAIYMILAVLKKTNKKSIVLVLCSVLMLVGATNIVKWHTECIVGKSISDGVPTTAWVAMGMQEGYMAYGWHNQYNENVYRENDCDSDKTNRVVKAEINDRVHSFISNPAYFAKFFYQKTISQWNNPTFEGFWINDRIKRANDGIKVKKLPNWLNGLTMEPGNKFLTEYMNLYQTIILVGASICIICKRKENTIGHFIPAIIFVGGFVFHIIWEAKCQYVMPYFVLLIPYAISGYDVLTKKLCDIKMEQGIIQCVKKYREIQIIIIVAILGIMISIFGQRYIDKALGFSEQQYQQYIADALKEE